MRKLFSITLLLSLSACGTMPTDRALSGAGIGAGAGAVLGAVSGISVLQGAAIGAAAGGLTGALTGRDQVNFGRPVWRNNPQYYRNRRHR